jgi:phosphoesterase RecJ-like protein
VYEGKIAYMKNDVDVKKEYNVSTFTVSRAMVNQMADIKDIEVWANFTKDDDGDIFVELRSKRVSIVDVARKYDGGGHALACGCTIRDFETADQILKDLYTVLEGSNLNG